MSNLRITFRLLAAFASIVMLVLMSLCTFSRVEAQTGYSTAQFNGTGYGIVQYISKTTKGIAYTASVYEDIGADNSRPVALDDSQVTDIYRTMYQFNLVNTGIDPNYITSVTLHVTYSQDGNNPSSSSLNISQMSATEAPSQQSSAFWQHIGAGTSYWAGVKYGGSNPTYYDETSGSFTSAVKSAINSSSGILNVGVYCTEEGKNGDAAQVHLTLVVKYNALCSVTVENSFAGGSLIIDGTQYNNVGASGVNFSWRQGTQQTLQAIDNQAFTIQGNTYNYTYSNWTDRTGSQVASTLSYTFTVTEGNTYKANFSQTITPHYTTSGTMASSEDWKVPPVNLTGNLTIPSGVTLTIESGVTVNLNGYYLVPAGGAINNYGTIRVSEATIQGVSGYFGSIQAAIDYASSGQTVQVQSGSFSESPSFSSRSNLTLAGQGQGSTIINGTVSITNSSGISVSNLTLNNLSLNNNTSTNISNVTATSTTLATVYGGTGNEFYTVTASNIGASFGLTSYDGTGDVASGSSISNGDCGVYLTNNASYNVGTNDEFCSNGLDIDALNGAYAYSINNTYSRINPVSVAGNVVVAGNIWSCGGISSPAKGAKTTSGVNTGMSVSLQPTPLQVADSAYLALLRQISDDKTAKKYDPRNYTQGFNNLLTSYKNFVNSKNDKGVVKAALSKLSYLYEAMGDEADFTAYITRALASGSFNSIQPYFERYLIWNYVDSSEYDNAIKTADAVLASPGAGDDLKAEMLYEEGLIYKYYLADSAKANEMFASLVSSYPSSALTRFVDIEKTVNPSYSDKNNHQSADRDQKTPGIGLSNYPNPFNPTTLISYQLPTNGYVTLRVYDVLGRLVATLVNRHEDAGQHTVQFNGQNLASGIYLYRLTAPGIEQVKKMILMK